MGNSTPPMETLSERLNYALEVTGMRKADLARAIDVKPQIIQFLCTSSTKSSRFTFEIATVLGLNTHWLATGEGEMFVANDPKQQLLSQCRRVPILNTEQLLLKAKGQKEINSNSIAQEWAVLKTNEPKVFCTVMTDASMESTLPFNSQVFFKEKLGTESPLFNANEIVISYLPQHNAIMIRKILIKGGNVYLAPINDALFKEVALTEDVKIFGSAIECHVMLNA